MLVLTKPISRTRFTLNKAVSQVVLLICASIVSVALCIAGTAALFGSASIGPLLETAGLWLIFPTMIQMLALMVSAAVRSQPAFPQRAPRFSAGTEQM